MVNYDEGVIQEFADRLYATADGIIMSHSAIGALLGFLGGYMIGGGSVGIIVMLIGGAIGYWLGMQKAFHLKLQAQLALCQVQIERNSRLGAEGRGTSRAAE